MNNVGEIETECIQYLRCSENSIKGRRIKESLCSSVFKRSPLQLSQSHWASGLRPLSGILNKYKIQHFRNSKFFQLHLERGRHIICCVPYKKLTTVTVPKTVHVSCLSPEDGNRCSCRNVMPQLLRITRRWKQSQSPVILNIVLHRYNSIKSTTAS